MKWVHVFGTVWMQADSRNGYSCKGQLQHQRTLILYYYSIYLFLNSNSSALYIPYRAEHKIDTLDTYTRANISWASNRIYW